MRKPEAFLFYFFLLLRNTNQKLQWSRTTPFFHLSSHVFTLSFSRWPSRRDYLHTNVVVHSDYQAGIGLEDENMEDITRFH